MDICLNFDFLKEIRSTDLLTYLALLLAYVGYTWSVKRDFSSWKSIFVSFKKDLKAQEQWLSSEYFEELYQNKNSFDPGKIIFPLSFESLPEIIRRGVAEFPQISEEFISHLAIFNERVIAFNSLLDHMKRIVSADPIKTEKLIDKLNDFVDLDFNDLKKKIFDLKKEDEIFYLAENIRRLNKIIHVKLIGDKSKKDKLYFLYSEITKELDNLLYDFNKKRPFFINHELALIFLSIPIFLIIENFLK